jgi:hypothetical protein
VNHFGGPLVQTRSPTSRPVHAVNYLSVSGTLTSDLASSVALLVLGVFLCNATLVAQKPGAPSQSATTPTPNAPSPTSASGGPSSGLQGISFARESWDRALVAPDFTQLGLRNPKELQDQLVLLCYKLVPANSGTQPFIFEPQIPPPAWKQETRYKDGEVAGVSQNGHYYEAVLKGRSGPTPPSVPNNPSIGVVLGETHSLSWRFLGSQPRSNAHNWEPYTPYPFDIIVSIPAPPPIGKYYLRAIPQPSLSNPPTNRQGLLWKDMGTSVPDDAHEWQPEYLYLKGSHVVYPSQTNHYYEAQDDGISASDPPNFPTDGGKLEDSLVGWNDLGKDVWNANVNAKCSNVSAVTPLLMNNILVLVIDTSELPSALLQRVKLINMNVTNQQGASLNPTPIRPSLTAGSASGPELGLSNELVRTRKPYFLTWPNPLPGDTIPTVTVNLVYTPVAPALPWENDTFYPAGSIVISSDGRTTNGHYYVALNSGISNSSPAPQFDAAAVPLPLFEDGTGVYWINRGSANPAPVPAPLSWTKGMHSKGENVTPTSPNGNYYQALNDGTSGTTEPTFPTGEGALVYDGNADGLTWVFVGLTAVSPTPPTWQKNMPVAKDAFVVPAPANGYYYQAQTKGGAVSGTTASGPPAFPTKVGDTVPDGTVTWKNMGLTVVNPATTPAWQQGIAYSQNSLVTPPTPGNGYYYRAQTDGVSGPSAPPFPATPGTVTEHTLLTWVDAGTSLPTNTKLKAWAPLTPFFVGDTTLYAPSGHYYSAIQAGVSGKTEPPFNVPAPKSTSENGGNDPQVRWQDIGAVLPASVSAGTPPSDLTVALLNYTYPQVHALSRFNLASGVIASTIRTPNILTIPASGTTLAMYKASRGVPIVDPVLAVTAYFGKGMDAERPFRRRDFIPGATLAFSLQSPTTNYYVGFSSEFLVRNLQLFYGASVARVTSVSPTDATLQQQKFRAGGFAGFTFNITGFIQSLIP